MANKSILRQVIFVNSPRVIKRYAFDHNFANCFLGLIPFSKRDPLLFRHSLIQQIALGAYTLMVQHRPNNHLEGDHLEFLDREVRASPHGHASQRPRHGHGYRNGHSIGMDEW